jgi:hypothetical protein
MVHDDQIRRLRARARRCRELAETATDAEVAAALLETAEDIERAIPMIEAGGKREEDGAGE